MQFQVRKAARRKLKTRMAIMGPSGSGKTYSSLAIASGIVGAEGEGGKIYVIDTEHGSADRYAHRFDFMSVELPNFDPRSYARCIEWLQKTYDDCAVIIVDSLSHAWAGPGGALALVDRYAKASKSGSSFNAWGEVTPRHDELIAALTSAKCHVIATMRSKTKYEMVENSRGKVQPVKLGLGPVQRDGMDYEFDFVLDIGRNHTARVDKTRYDGMKLGDQDLDGLAIEKPGVVLGETMARWLDDGLSEEEVQAQKDADRRRQTAIACVDKAKDMRERRAAVAKSTPALLPLYDAVAAWFEEEKPDSFIPVYQLMGRLFLAVSGKKPWDPIADLDNETGRDLEGVPSITAAYLHTYTRIAMRQALADAKPPTQTQGEEWLKSATLEQRAKLVEALRSVEATDRYSVVREAIAGDPTPPPTDDGPPSPEDDDWLAHVDDGPADEDLAGYDESEVEAARHKPRTELDIDAAVAEIDLASLSDLTRDVLEALLHARANPATARCSVLETAIRRVLRGVRERWAPDLYLDWPSVRAALDDIGLGGPSSAALLLEVAVDAARWSEGELSEEDARTWALTRYVSFTALEELKALKPEDRWHSVRLESKLKDTGRRPPESMEWIEQWGVMPDEITRWERGGKLVALVYRDRWTVIYSLDTKDVKTVQDARGFVAVGAQSSLREALAKALRQSATLASRELPHDGTLLAKAAQREKVAAAERARRDKAETAAVYGESRDVRRAAS